MCHGHRLTHLDVQTDAERLEVPLPFVARVAQRCTQSGCAPDLGYRIADAQHVGRIYNRDAAAAGSSSTRTAETLYSGVPISGSPTSCVSQFTFACAKWRAIQTRPG